MRTGNKTDTVMKTGDDLRQDQVILGMLELFNSIWKREGVVHIIAGSMAVVPGATKNSTYVVEEIEPRVLRFIVCCVVVYAPLYRCSASGISRGFVEMLPRSTPVSPELYHVSPLVSMLITAYLVGHRFFQWQRRKLIDLARGGLALRAG